MPLPAIAVNLFSNIAVILACGTTENAVVIHSVMDNEIERLRITERRPRSEFHGRL